MNSLMFVAFASCLAQAVLASYYPWYGYSSPVVLPSGYLADTPEVAAAKSAHFAEVAKAGGVVPYDSSGYVPTVTPDGYLADAPDVAAAKTVFFAEYAKAASGASGYPYPYGYAYGYPYGYPYSYPYGYPYSTYGNPVVLPGGYLADTPEVAAAKVAHFAEVTKATDRAR